MVELMFNRYISLTALYTQYTIFDLHLGNSILFLLLLCSRVSGWNNYYIVEFLVGIILHNIYSTRKLYYIVFIPLGNSTT
jgi:hypothetical protein